MAAPRESSEATAAGPGPRVRAVLYSALAASALVAPMALWKAEKALLPGVLRGPDELMRLFGFCASAALIAAAWLEVRRRQRSLRALLPVLLFLLVAFQLLIVFVEGYAPSGDYACFQAAARAITEGRNPYEGTMYLYPPLFAQTLALAHRAISAAARIAGMDVSAYRAWELVFYLYQGVQYLLAVAAWLLCYRMVRALGLGRAQASVLVTVLLLVNNPLVRTIKFNQTNLVLLDLMLVAFLVIRRHPWLSGLCAALGAHVKLYPALPIVYWAALRRYRAVLWALAGLAGVFLVQTDFGRDLSLWKDFLGFAGSFPVHFSYFRNNSFHGLIFNLVHLAGRLTGLGHDAAGVLTQGLVLATSAGMLLWFGVRFYRREKAFRGRVPPGGTETPADGTVRLWGHWADSLALMLLLSRLAWEHHYILTLPVILFAAVTQGPRRPWLTGLAAFLILALPTFDVFPFSYHRLAGLLMLVWLMTPGCRTDEGWKTQCPAPADQSR